MHVIDSLSPGGAERMLVDLANQSTADGHVVFVCITRSGDQLAAGLRPEIQVIALGRRTRFELRALIRLARFIRAQKIEVLHGHGRTTYSLLLLLTALRLSAVPYVFHDHFGGVYVDPSVPLWIRLSAPLGSCQYVGVHERLSAWAVKAGFRPERVKTIGNAIDLGRIACAEQSNVRAECEVVDGELLGVAVAGVRPEKGIDTLVRALAPVVSRVSLKFAVVGGERDPAYAAQCRELAHSLGLDRAIRFLGERDDVQAILRDADFAVMPSRSESGPLVLIEYLAAGLPFVSTRVGNVAHRVDGLGVPEFVEPEDSSAMAEAIVRLLTMNPDERSSRAAAGRNVALEHFDVRVVMDRWYDVYQSMVASA